MVEKNFYKKLFILAVPIIIQQFIQAALNMVDTIMIGKLGVDEIAAVGIANQVFFIVMMIIFGINSGISVYIAQFFGRKDKNNIKKTIGLSLKIGFIIGIIFSAIAFTMPEKIMRMFTDDKNVIFFGVEYLKYISFSYIFMGISLTFHIASRSIGKTMMPMIVSAIALSLNTVLNFGLIFGNFYMPELGVQGAAIATLIARCFELVLMILIIYIPKSLLAVNIKNIIDLDFKFILEILKKAGPVLVNEIFWGLGTVVYMWSISHIGTEAIASYQIAGSIFRFYEVIFIGFASAVSVMIGNNIGANKEGIAKIEAFKVVKLTFVTSIAISIILVLIVPSILNNFNVSTSVINNAYNIFLVYSIYGISRMFNLIMIVGVLRGGGDTGFAMTIEIISVWLIGVPLSIIGGVMLKLSVVTIVALIMTEEIIKSIVCYKRLKSFKWIHNVIKNI